jgi:BirA family transcriptional regulator, biotin operon repressor / biotin---[acetyl-CoA-carboxylase] ligase
MFAELPADLRRALDAARGRLGAFADLRYAETIGSTNDTVMQLAAACAPEGAAVLAEEQTAGRGRRGRAWSSPPGAGLYLSVLLRGDTLTRAPGLSTLGAGVAAAQAIAIATGLRVSLKWPNDLVIGDGWKKLGGILCEANGPDALVVGVGINITPAAHPPEVAARAASIEGELGRGIDRAVLVVECLDQLRMLALTLRAGRGREVLGQWRDWSADGWQGATVQWQDGEHDARGVARDVDDDGALVVDRDGRRERVIAGEVVWRRHP